MWTWASTSACALYGERRRNRKDLPVTGRPTIASFPQSVLELKLFFLWQFVSVYNSRSSHLDVGNMVATSIFLMFHGQLLSSLAYFIYWQNQHINALSRSVLFVNPHTTRRWTQVLWTEFNEKQQTDPFTLAQTSEAHHSESKTSILLTCYID